MACVGLLKVTGTGPMWLNEEKEVYLPRNWISSLEEDLKLN